jgi:hypothetical protein
MVSIWVKYRTCVCTKICAYVTLCVNTSYTNMWHVLQNTLSKLFEIVIIKLNSFEKTFWWSCKYKSRSKKFTWPLGLVPMKFLLSDGWITCPGLRASGLRRRLVIFPWLWDLKIMCLKMKNQRENKSCIIF